MNLNYTVLILIYLAVMSVESQRNPGGPRGQGIIYRIFFSQFFISQLIVKTQDSKSNFINKINEITNNKFGRYLNQPEADSNVYQKPLQSKLLS